MKKIGFIGTGVMGSSMVSHLLAAGYTVSVYNRTREKAQPVIDKGAIWLNSPKEIAKENGVIMTMLGYPSDVQAIYLGDEGLINNAASDTLLIDFTTSTPTLAKEIFSVAAEKNIHAIDAPVSGGDIGAKNATLTIMCGGTQETYDKCLPLLDLLGKNIIRQGEAGAGQHTKMCNQIAIAAGMLGVCEAISYARKAGLDPEKVLESISNGAAGSWSLSNYGPRILKGDFSPGFYVKHFIKDMKIALDEAKKLNLPVPGLELAARLYEELAASEGDNDGTQALYKWYQTH